jgi:hypothetical protein
VSQTTAATPSTATTATPSHSGHPVADRAGLEVDLRGGRLRVAGLDLLTFHLTWLTGPCRTRASITRAYEQVSYTL